MLTGFTMKYLILFAIFTKIAGAIDCNSTNHDAFFGTRTPYDEFDFMDYIKEERKLFRVVEAVITYPLEFQKSPENNIITYIEVLDQLKNGNNGCPSLVKGGPGYNHTQIKLTSKRGQGLNFVTRIYVKRHYSNSEGYRSN